jgi:phosphonate transport system permease protein
MKRSSVVIDLVIGAYLVAVLWRVVVPGVAGYSPADFSSIDLWLIVGGAVACGLMSVTGMASLGQLFLTGTLLPKPLAQKLTQHLGWFTLVVSVAAGWIITDVSPMEFFSGEGLAGAGRIFGALARPNFGILGDALDAMVVTIFTALMATLAAVPISFLLAFPAASNVMRASAGERWVYGVLRALLNITRSMEPIIWAIIFSVWVGIGPFAGMLALVVHTIASLAKLYSEQIEGVADGPIEAIEAAGASRLQVLWFAVVPQCVLPFLSFTIYRWDINVRMATIIGFVGGGGIGTLLTQYQGLSKYQEVGALVMIITLVVWLMDAASARIRAVLK